MKVSIISVNYNGKHLLKNFLDSVSNINYPKDQYETIIVDNASKDGSVKYLKKQYPWVRVIEAGENLGFGRGNNLGIKAACGKYFLLVNNDTFLEKDSVANMVDCFERWSKDQKIGAVSAKLVFYDKYLSLKVKKAYFHDYSFPKPFLPVNKRLYILKSFVENPYCEEVYLPMSHKVNLGLKAFITLKKQTGNNYALQIGNKVLDQGSMHANCDFKVIPLKLSKEDVRRFSLDLIQNSGTYLFRDGYGRDRGTIIVGGKEYYEADRGQYDKEEFVQAFCGAGVLISREAIGDIGMFDPLFFMYYEDDDLSLRLKEKGWKIVYCPKAIIRHIHAASSVEWSKNFIFNVEKNRMLFVAKHWPRSIVLWEWLKYIIKDTLGVPIYHVFYGEFREAAGRFILRLKVNLNLLYLIPYCVLRSKRLRYKDLKKFQ